MIIRKIPWSIQPPAGAPIDPSNPINDGLVGCWPLSESSGDTAYDISGNKNHGTLVNNPSRIVDRYGRALSFNGSNQYINIPANVISSNNALAFSTWISPTNNLSRYVLIGHQNVVIPNRLFRVQLYDGPGDAYNANYIQVLIGNSSGGWGLVWYANVVVPPNTRSLLTVSWDGTTAFAYLNRAQVTQTGYSGVLASSSYYWQIGVEANTFNPYNGSRGEFRVYNRAISEREHVWLYDNRFGAYAP